MYSENGIFGCWVFVVFHLKFKWSHKLCDKNIINWSHLVNWRKILKRVNGELCTEKENENIYNKWIYVLKISYHLMLSKKYTFCEKWLLAVISFENTSSHRENTSSFEIFSP